MYKNVDKNEFIKKTIEGLGIDENDPRLGTRGFEIDNSESEKDCILVMGLNLAGDEKDAKSEKKNRTYLYSLRNGTIKGCSYIYNLYYRPIYNLMCEIFYEDVKWSWCNKDWNSLKTEIENSDDKSILDKIWEEYNYHKRKKVTIYMGDMFYYHETNSKKLLKKGKDYADYYNEMLTLHIDYLKNSNKNIKFIYINNAGVSNSMCGNSLKTVEEYNNKNDNSKIPIFYGGMLSCPIDSFSKKRLVNEIKNYLNKEK